MSPERASEADESEKCIPLRIPWEEPKVWPGSVWLFGLLLVHTLLLEVGRVVWLSQVNEKSVVLLAVSK
jgi:hypothetical protein